MCRWFRQAAQILGVSYLKKGQPPLRQNQNCSHQNGLLTPPPPKKKRERGHHRVFFLPPGIDVFPTPNRLQLPQLPQAGDGQGEDAAGAGRRGGGQGDGDLEPGVGGWAASRSSGSPGSGPTVTHCFVFFFLGGKGFRLLK